MQMPARQAARIASRSVLLARRLPLLSVRWHREALVGAPGKLLGGGVEADLRLRDQGEEGDDGAVQVLGLGVVLGRLQFLGTSTPTSSPLAMLTLTRRYQDALAADQAEVRLGVVQPDRDGDPRP